MPDIKLYVNGRWKRYNNIQRLIVKAAEGDGTYDFTYKSGTYQMEHKETGADLSEYASVNIAFPEYTQALQQEDASNLEQISTLTGKVIDAGGTEADMLDAFPAWAAATAYKANKIVKHNSILYKCLQAHTSQAGWEPGVAASLWVRVNNPGEEWPAWIQPTGAHDAYSAGDKVSHNSKHWVSAVDANVWEPGATGTEALWTEAD